MTNSSDLRPKIVAELAKEHGGSVDNAKGMIVAAADAGFDAIKLQAYDVDDLIPSHPNYERNKECHLDIDEIQELYRFAHSLGLESYSSVFSRSLIRELAAIDMNQRRNVKIPATFAQKEDYVSLCFKYFDYVHISLGMHEPDELARTIHQHKERTADGKVPVFYHCISLYPTPLESLKLNRLHMIRLLSMYKSNEMIFVPPLGFSDHTQGIYAPFTAWLMGASYIEKHFGFDNKDKPWIITPGQAKALISRIDKHVPYLEDGIMSRDEANIHSFYSREFKDLL